MKCEAEESRFFLDSSVRSMKAVFLTHLPEKCFGSHCSLNCSWRAKRQASSSLYHLFKFSSQSCVATTVRRKRLILIIKFHSKTSMVTFFHKGCNTYSYLLDGQGVQLFGKCNKIGPGRFYLSPLWTKSKGAITLTETLKTLKHCADLSYYDITSARSH